MPDAPSVNDSQPEATTAATPDADLQGEPIVTIQNGRRRGRRRVTKKKKVKDDEGYLGESSSHSCRIHMLTSHSDQGRNCLGVVFRGRARAKEGQARTRKAIKCCKGKACWQEGAGQHSQLLQESLSGSGEERCSAVRRLDNPTLTISHGAVVVPTGSWFHHVQSSKSVNVRPSLRHHASHRPLSFVARSPIITYHCISYWRSSWFCPIHSQRRNTQFRKISGRKGRAQMLSDVVQVADVCNIAVVPHAQV